MFINYLKIAWRNLLKNKLYSFINIGGLSVGIAVSMLIMVYVIHEYRYDNFHKNADRIYSVLSKTRWGSNEMEGPGLSYPSAPAIAKASPSVESFVRTSIYYDKKANISTSSSSSAKFAEGKFLFADSNFFDFFSFPLIQGTPGQVLSRPFTVVITENAARKYFGDADPIGRILTYDSSYNFEVTGISKNVPSNSSIDYDFVASISSVLAMNDGERIRQQQYSGYGEFDTYLLLRKSASPEIVATTIKKLADRRADQNGTGSYRLIGLSDSHLERNFRNNSNTRYLKIFTIVAGLILLLALINYMSLATAAASLRSKEIAVRKVTGASSGRIAQQFYIESGLYAAIAYVAGYLLFIYAKPFFYNRIELFIDPSFIYQPLVLATFAALLLITIIVAGTYPAIVLSAYSPVAILYNKFSTQKGGISVRKFFTVLQFTISVAMIVCSMIIERQMYFFRHTDTGLSKENIIMIPFQNTIRDHYQAFKTDVSNLAGISQVSTSHYPMYKGTDNIGMLSQKDNAPLYLPMLNVDDQFISLLNIQWKIKPTDKLFYNQEHSVVINETVISKLGLSTDPIGEQISLDKDTKYTVTGVVKNFNFTSLHKKIDALALFVKKDTAVNWGSLLTGCLFVKINPGVNIPTLIESIGKIYDNYDKVTPFEFEFMEDAFNAQYKAEDRLAAILSIFTGLTIAIACLGLFGLAAFSSAQRTKEIGVRKVLGASVENIVRLLATDFVKHILISIVIAVPLSWLIMSEWLNNFAYRVTIGWGIFALAALLTITISLLTVSMHAIKAAMANPVKSLKSE